MYSFHTGSQRTDSAGNATVRTVNVTVPLSQKK